MKIDLSFSDFALLLKEVLAWSFAIIFCCAGAK